MTDQTFEQIYKDYLPQLTKRFSLKIKDKQEVEDLVQDTMLRVSNNLSTYDSSKAVMSTWLYTIADNTLANYFRDNSRQPQLIQTDVLYDTVHTHTYDSPENMLIADQDVMAINKAAQELNDVYYTVYQLKEVEGLSLQQISDQLDIPINTVKSRHKRAKDYIKKALSCDTK